MIEPVAPKNPTPGSLLRHQRQHIGWTVDEIANALCLSPDLIRALESDDYDDMGGSTFALGYLRGYARLVGIDIEEAIVNHRDAIPEYAPDPDHVPEGVRERKRSPRHRRWLLPAGALVLAGAVGAAYYWLQPGPSGNHSRVTDNLTVEVPRENTSQAAMTPPERHDRLQGVDASELRRALAGGELPVNLVLADIAPSRGEEQAPVATAAADDTRRHLVLIFDEGSWADVRDAEGERLLSQIVAGGSSVDLVGEPPFTVFLGNAGGVRVKYLGRIQSYSQTEKGLFARFTVGQQQ